MDMHQKRKMRQEKNDKKNEEEVNNKMNINWVMVIYENYLKSAEISRLENIEGNIIYNDYEVIKSIENILMN